MNTKATNAGTVAISKTIGLMHTVFDFFLDIGFGGTASYI